MITPLNDIIIDGVLNIQILPKFPFSDIIDYMYVVAQYA